MIPKLTLKTNIKGTLITMWSLPADTGGKMNVRKTFRRRPGPLLNVLCTFNLRPVFTGKSLIKPTMTVMSSKKHASTCD